MQGDTYPTSYAAFTKKDCPFNYDLEKHYQTMLDLSYKFNIPYLGICAGAQHFSLYHGGSLSLLNKESINYDASRTINFIKGTLPYFLSLTKLQQSQVLQDCELPEVSFSGHRAHSFAAIIGKLGEDMQLGAIAGDDVAMSYAHSNGIRYATQFHPEHYYKYQDDNSINQRAWLDNFVELAEMYHAHRINNAIHPIEYISTIKDRLETCMVNPTCLAGEYSYESLFDGRGFFNQ